MCESHSCKAARVGGCESEQKKSRLTVVVEGCVTVVWPMLSCCAGYFHSNSRTRTSVMR